MITEKNKIRPLCLSFRTPPSNRPQAILISKMLPEWIAQGVIPAVVTYDAGGDWDIGAPVYKISQFDINKYLNKIPFVHGFLRNRYYKGILDEIEGIIKKHSLNMIFSFSNPQESNIIGAMLKKRLGIPFVSYFSDPWYDYPYDPPLRPWTASKILRQESFIVKNSDKAVFVNNQARELIMKKFPLSWKEKAEVIPHCYDLKDYPEDKREDNDKYIFSYIGIFYKDRNPEIFFMAFEKIFKERPELKNKVEIRIIGMSNNYTGYGIQDVEKAVSKYGLEENVKLIPPVSYKESLRYMKLSDCLIVLDLNIPQSPFLPSKVVDYAGSGSIILGITPEDSPARDFLNNLGYKVFNYNQVDDLSVYLKKLILGEIKINVNQDFLRQYDARNTTVELIKLFNEVLNK
jgi:glycosyltransferase involved in cell wall biosynthesis